MQKSADFLCFLHQKVTFLALFCFFLQIFTLFLTPLAHLIDPKPHF